MHPSSPVPPIALPSLHTPNPNPKHHCHPPLHPLQPTPHRHHHNSPNLHPIPNPNLIPPHSHHHHVLAHIVHSDDDQCSCCHSSGTPPPPSYARCNDVNAAAHTIIAVNPHPQSPSPPSQSSIITSPIDNHYSSTNFNKLSDSSVDHHHHQKQQQEQGNCRTAEAAITIVSVRQQQQYVAESPHSNRAIADPDPNGRTAIYSKSSDFDPRCAADRVPPADVDIIKNGVIVGAAAIKEDGPSIGAKIRNSDDRSNSNSSSSDPDVNYDFSQGHDDRGAAEEHVIYTLRRNPKRNRRFLNQDSLGTGGGNSRPAAVHEELQESYAKEEQIMVDHSSNTNYNQRNSSFIAIDCNQNSDCKQSQKVKYVAIDYNQSCNYRGSSAVIDPLLSNSVDNSSPHLPPDLIDQNQIDHNPRATIAAAHEHPNPTNHLKKSTAFANLQETARPACSECGKEFHSWKALFGHMRCHPEREWRGIQPPAQYASSYNNHGSNSRSASTSTAMTCAPIARSDHVVLLQNPHLQSKPAQAEDSRKSKSANWQMTKQQKNGNYNLINVDVVHADPLDRHRGEELRRLSAAAGDAAVAATGEIGLEGKEAAAALEEEEESEAESIEAAYISCSSKDMEFSNYSSRRIKNNAEDDDRLYQKNNLSRQMNPDAAAASPAAILPAASPMRGKRSRRRSQPTLKSLKSMEFAKHFNGNCKVPLICTTDYSRSSRYRGQIREEVEMANCLIMLAFAGSFVEKEEDLLPLELEEDAYEEDVAAAEDLEEGEIEVAAAAADSDDADDGTDDLMAAKDNWEMNCGDNHFLRHPVMVDDAGGAAKIGDVAAAGGDQRFECSTCKKIFKSHQALGGHRASHKKVKGCFARATTPPPLDLGEIPKVGAAAEGNYSSGSYMIAPSSGRDTSSSSSETGLLRMELLPTLMKHRKISSSNSSNSAAATTPLMKSHHQCSICYRVFSSGQALGGHKRCHWTADKASIGGAMEPPPLGVATIAASNVTDDVAAWKACESSSQGGKLMHFDLNLPAPQDPEQAPQSRHHQQQQQQRSNYQQQKVTLNTTAFHGTTTKHGGGSSIIGSLLSLSHDQLNHHHHQAMLAAASSHISAPPPDAAATPPSSVTHHESTQPQQQRLPPYPAVVQQLS